MRIKEPLIEEREVDLFSFDLIAGGFILLKVKYFDDNGLKISERNRLWRVRKGKVTYLIKRSFDF